MMLTLSPAAADGLASKPTTAAIHKTGLTVIG
jgi:hypothetical protein